MRTLLAAPLLALPLLVPVVGLTATPAAADFRCSGSVGAVSIDDTLVVPSGATCTLTRTRVQGDVKVYRGAKLLADDVFVGGNVQAVEAASVTVRNTSFVNGDVQAEKGGSARVLDSQVGGNVQYVEQRSALAVERTVVDGDVQAFKNTGGVKVLGNTIGGNLQCKENSPAPTGGGNRVSGNKEDQCRSL